MGFLGFPESAKLFWIEMLKNRYMTEKTACF